MLIHWIYVLKFSDTLKAGSLMKSSRQRQRTSLVWWSSDHCSCFSCDPQREKHRNDRRTVGDLIPLGMAKRPPTAHSKNRRVASKADLLCGLIAGFGHLIRHQTPQKNNEYSLEIEIVCSLVQFEYIVYLLWISCTVWSGILQWDIIGTAKSIEPSLAGDLPTQQRIMQELRTNPFHDPWAH